MNTEYLVIYTIVLGVLIFFIQRTEAKRRLVVLIIMGIPFLLLRNLAVFRDVEREAWVGLAIALVLNFLFWVLIGRYNPVGSSDQIQVLGMDD